MEDLIQSDLYEVLGVSGDAAEDEIEKRYQKLTKQFHSDKNPETDEKFKEITFAYNVLSNKDKRQRYDRFGLKGLKEDEDAMRFSMVKLTKAPTILIRLPVSLEEMFNGGIKTFEFKRTEFCPNCKGVGGTDPKHCPSCHGNWCSLLGLPGITGFDMAPCKICGGRCVVVEDNNRCKSCSGTGLTTVDEKREIIIEKGVPNRMKIPFRDIGNQSFTGNQGDIHVFLVQKKHPLFTRHNNDLSLRRVNINITEALSGMKYHFKHLDGRKLYFEVNPGDVIKPNHKKIIIGEGMPHFRNDNLERGDLYVEFSLDFPDNNFASIEQLKILEQILPPRKPFVMPPDPEHVDLVEFKPRDDTAEAFNASGFEFTDDTVQCTTG